MGDSVVGLLPPNPELVALGVREVIDRALAEGSVEPPWIAVDDGGGEWLPLVAACPAAERARGVVLSSSDTAIVAANRLGVGGAATLPLSSTGLREALGAASRASLPAPVGDPGMFEVLADAPGLKIAAFSRCGFWRAQLGDRLLARLLAELARAMGSPPAVLPWPALVVSDRNEDQIRKAWKPLASGPGKPADDLVVLDVAPGPQGVLAAVYSALINQQEEPRLNTGDVSEPVHELPSGRLVGWWAPESAPERADGWVAVPVETSGFKCRWELKGSDGATTVAEVTGPEDLAEIDGVAAVRVPGSLTGNTGPGTPAGLLVQRLADAAALRGLPLWVPNVDTQALKFLLRLPGTLWVDGPAVPR